MSRLLPARKILGNAAFAAVAAILLTGAGTATAQTFCSEPLAPSCIDIESTARDAPSIERCAQDVENYAEKVTEYLQCQEQKAKSLQSSIEDARRRIQEMKDAEAANRGTADQP